MVLTPKPLRQNLMLDNNQLADLLVAKDKELKQELKSAKEQEDIHKKMIELQEEVDKHDQQIKQLQKHFKEAEHILVWLLISFFLNNYYNSALILQLIYN